MTDTDITAEELRELARVLDSGADEGRLPGYGLSQSAAALRAYAAIKSAQQVAWLASCRLSVTPDSMTEDRRDAQ